MDFCWKNEKKNVFVCMLYKNLSIYIYIYVKKDFIYNLDEMSIIIYKP